MSFGTQKNGLSIECTRDTIGVHDFADVNTWVVSTSDSKWTLDPTNESSAYHDKVVRVIAMQLDLAEDILMASGQEMLVEFFVSGTASAVCTYTYADMSDWISRALHKQKVENSANVGNFIQYNIEFAQKPTFWTSTGVDAAGETKLNKMVLRIANNTPYKKATDSNTCATLARPRYFVEIYDDPDV
jgi:hypothetical protein